MNKRMIKWAYIFLLLLLLADNQCFVENYWDYYYESLGHMEIGDLTRIESGIYIDSLPTTGTIYEVEISVDIIHTDPFNLDISMVYENDTVSVWKNNFPGGVQVQSIEAFNQSPANGYWSLIVYDEVEDSKEGCLNKFCLKFNYIVY